MANTIAYSDKEVQVTFDGSTAWDPAQQYRVLSFEFLPNANSDTITVRETSATGNVVFYQKVSATVGISDQRKGYEYGHNGTGKDITPYVVGNEATASSKLVMKYA